MFIHLMIVWTTMHAYHYKNKKITLFDKAVIKDMSSAFFILRENFCWKVYSYCPTQTC